MDAMYSTYVTLCVVLVLLHRTNSESKTACCCPGGTANYPSSGLNVSCPSNTVSVVAFTKLFSYSLNHSGTCPQIPNESAAVLQSPVEQGYLVQYAMSALSGRPTPHDPVSLPTCEGTDRSVLVYDYTCIDPLNLVEVCSDDVKNVSSRTLGIWSNNFGDSPSNLSVINGACKCYISTTSRQIQITSYNNGLADSQDAKISESNGYVLRLWDGTFFYGDIGKTTVHNLTSGNLTFEWMNPRNQHGSIWVVITAIPTDGTLQIQCEEPLLNGNIPTSTPSGLPGWSIAIIIIVVVVVVVLVGALVGYKKKCCCNNRCNGNG